MRMIREPLSYPNIDITMCCTVDKSRGRVDCRWSIVQDGRQHQEHTVEHNCESKQITKQRTKQRTKQKNK